MEEIIDEIKKSIEAAEKNEEFEELEDNNEFDKSPKYVTKETIDKVLTLNVIQSKIDEVLGKINDVRNKITNTEEELKVIDEKRQSQLEELSSLNESNKRNEIQYNLGIANETNSEYRDRQNKLDSLYGDLNKLEAEKTACEEEYKESESRLRDIVGGDTTDYALADEECKNNVDKFVEASKNKDFDRAEELSKKVEELTKELVEYKKFNSFEAILKSSKEEEKEAEKNEEPVNEEVELKEVSVDELADESKEEIKEEEISEQVEETKEEEIVEEPTPVVESSKENTMEEDNSEQVIETEGPTFEDLLSGDQKEAIDVPENASENNNGKDTTSLTPLMDSLQAQPSSVGEPTNKENDVADKVTEPVDKAKDVADAANNNVNHIKEKGMLENTKEAQENGLRGLSDVPTSVVQQTSEVSTIDQTKEFPKSEFVENAINLAENAKKQNGPVLKFDNESTIKESTIADANKDGLRKTEAAFNGEKAPEESKKLTLEQ